MYNIIIYNIVALYWSHVRILCGLMSRTDGDSCEKWAGDSIKMIPSMVCTGLIVSKSSME